MTDFLIQRHDQSGPVEADGCWIDEGIARDLKAGDAKKAVEQIAAQHLDHLSATRRAIKWEHVSEHTTQPGGVKVEAATKAERTKG